MHFKGHSGDAKPRAELLPQQCFRRGRWNPAWPMQGHVVSVNTDASKTTNSWEQSVSLLLSTSIVGSSVGVAWVTHEGANSNEPPQPGDEKKQY
jgi:hypothetical protein